MSMWNPHPPESERKPLGRVRTDPANRTGAKEERKRGARKHPEKPHFLPRLGPSSSLQEAL